MDHLTFDVQEYLLTFIKSNKDKCRLMMTCKEISNRKFYFYETISVKKIIRSGWFDHFMSIYIDDRDLRVLLMKDFIPSSVTEITFGWCLNQYLENCIPSTVTHLNFNGAQAYYVDKYIPSSVTHLRISQFCNNCFRNIPSSITHLEIEKPLDFLHGNYSSTTHIIFGDLFIYPINHKFSQSVTHLKFGKRFNHPINDYIPSSVIEITFGESFNQSLLGIPTSVQEIIFIGNFADERKNNILKSAPDTKITFNISEKIEKKTFLKSCYKQ